MDTSFWKNLNPNILVQPTTKQFYDRYLCKLVMTVPCGRLIHSQGNLADGLAYRQQTQRQRYYGSYWGQTQTNKDQFESTSISQLEIIRSIKND